MSLSSCFSFGGEDLDREVLAMLTSPSNDLESLPGIHSQSVGDDYVNVTINSDITNDSTTSKIPVDLEIDKLTSLLQFVSFAFNIPTS